MVFSPVVEPEKLEITEIIYYQTGFAVSFIVSIVLVHARLGRFLPLRGVTSTPNLSKASGAIVYLDCGPRERKEKFRGEARKEGSHLHGVMIYMLKHDPLIARRINNAERLNQ